MGRENCGRGPAWRHKCENGPKIQKIFKTTKLNHITQGENTDGEEKKTKHTALMLPKTWRTEEENQHRRRAQSLMHKQETVAW